MHVRAESEKLQALANMSSPRDGECPSGVCAVDAVLMWAPVPGARVIFAIGFGEQGVSRQIEIPAEDIVRFAHMRAIAAFDFGKPHNLPPASCWQQKVAACFTFNSQL